MRQHFQLAERDDSTVENRHVSHKYGLTARFQMQEKAAFIARCGKRVLGQFPPRIGGPGCMNPAQLSKALGKGPTA